MRLLKSLPKLKKPRVRIVIRRVVGGSMLPTLRPNQVVVGHRFYLSLCVGDVVIVRHEGVDKIKRVTAVDPDCVFIEGDNRSASKDSRDFGAIPQENVIAKVVLFSSGRY